MCSRKCMFSEVHDRMLKNAKKKKVNKNVNHLLMRKESFRVYNPFKTLQVFKGIRK